MATSDPKNSRIWPWFVALIAAACMATFYIQLLNPCDYGFLDKTTYARSAILDFGSQQSAVIVYRSNSDARVLYQLARDELGPQGWISSQEPDGRGNLHNASSETIAIKLRSPQGYFVKHDGPIIIVARSATLMDRIRCWLEEKPWRRL